MMFTPMTRKLLLAVVFGIVALCATNLRAQTTKKDRGTINGIVLAANGKPVSNAAVTCQTSAGNKPRAAHTDAQGRFTIPGLRQDSYDLRASANGAYSDWERLVSLHHGETKSVTLYLLNGNDTPSGMRPAARKQKP